MPFTKAERRAVVQSRLGHRPTNNWGEGNLPAPWAEGDVVEIVDGTLVDPATAERIGRYPADGPAREMGDAPPPGSLVGFYVVTTAFSIDDGDAWYFRVDSTDGVGSDRLHVAHAERSNVASCDFMAPFRLVDTADRDGLRTRQEMLAAGWPTPDDFTPEQRCPHCQQVIPDWHDLYVKP
jgi:hypothetical protein